MGLCLKKSSKVDMLDYTSFGLILDTHAWSEKNQRQKFLSTNIMSQYKVHHDVSELIKLFGISADEDIHPETLIDLLSKNKVTYSSSQVGSHIILKKLAEQSPSPQEFIALYDKLKGKNVRDVNAVLQLLSKITEDPQTRSFLEKNAQQRAAQHELEKPIQAAASSCHSASGNKMSAEELSQLKDMLLKATADVTALPVLSDRESKKSVNANIPILPSWTTERPYMTLDFIESNNRQGNEGTLGAIPVTTQEHILLEDILCCLSGVEGKYILINSANNRPCIRNFHLDESTDPSLKEMVKRILPICSNYSTVVQFAEEKSGFEYGLVNHALSAAMRSFIKDYLLLVAQLEYQLREGLLTFQKLWFYLQPTKHTLEILSSIATSITKSNSKGGAVLNLLHEMTANLSGDTKAQELCLYLIQNACVPYFEILEKWIYKGVIYDIYGEFLIEDNELVQKEELPVDYSNDYWEKRYTICGDRIPGFLEKVVDMILRTGKYLNVIRQCGKDINCPYAEEIFFSNKESDYVACIEKAYNFASKMLLDLLIKESDLMGRLRSVKHYFLLDQGDFVVQFMDMAEDELKKNINDIMPTRLESLLGLAVRTSVANSDPYNDDVRVELLPFDLLTQMFKILSIETKDEKEYRIPMELNLLGLEAFSFDYEVKWPLSLILNRKAIACYQMLFRHLFFAKHVERLLCNVWISNRVAKSFPLNDARSYGAAFALRQRMLNFVQNIQYYMMFEVLEPNWNVFLSKMQMVSNVDDVLNCHMDFLNICLKDCMLTSPELLKMVNQLMTICITFSNFIQKMNKYSIEAELTGTTQSIVETEETEEQQTPESEVQPNVGESYEQKIDRFNQEFTELLVSLLDRISDIGQDNYNDKLLNILYRLDFNGFYTHQLENLAMERSVILDHPNSEVKNAGLA